MLRHTALAALCITAAALVAQRTTTPTATDDALANLRRAMAQKQPVSRKTFGTASVAAAVTAFARVAEVDASGGATAGGAYLLRAKERYNARVAEGAKAYKKSTDLAALFAEKDGALDDLEAVPQPLHRSSSDKGGAFKDVGDLVAELPPDGREHAVVRIHLLVPSI